jgi:hypothetical protein
MQKTKQKPDQYPDDLDRLLNEEEAANFLRYSMRALQNWRVRGGGPRFVKVSSRSIRYRRRDLIAWTETLLRSSTSQIDTA